MTDKDQMKVVKLLEHERKRAGDILAPEVMAFASEAELITGEKIDQLKNEIYQGIKENQKSFLKRKKEVNAGYRGESSSTALAKKLSH